MNPINSSCGFLACDATSDDLAVTILRVNVTLYCRGNPDIIDIMALKGGYLDNVTF
jgi:hypothetical protein